VPKEPDARDFLSALWDVVEEECFAELRLISQGPGRPKQSFFGYPSELDGLCADAQKASGSQNVFFGVGLRKRRSGKAEDVLCIKALWADIDFKTTPLEKAIALIKKFPLKPSMGILSGGGLHVYWVLREMVWEEDLKLIRPLNLKIAHALGGDKAATDIARILRLPGTLNLKYENKPTCKINVWRPELQYNITDFDFLPEVEEIKHVEATVVATSKPERQSHGIDMPEDFKKKIAGALASIWIPGYRNRLALYISGLMAHAGYNLKSCRDIIEHVVKDTKDEEGNSRLGCVGRTYDKFKASGAVAGGPAMKKMLVEEFPVALQDNAKKIYTLIRDSIKQHDDEAGSRFQIIKIKKYIQDDPIYEVTIGLEGEEYVTKCSNDEIFYSNTFAKIFFAAHHKFLPELKKKAWQKKVEGAGFEPVQIEKEEATLEGKVSSAITELMSAAVSTDQAETAAEHLPLKTEAGDQLFKLKVLNKYLRGQGTMARESEIQATLRKLGFNSASKRFGKNVMRLWSKPGKNGNLFPETPI